MRDSAMPFLDTIRYCTLSTVDADGLPWAAPVFYVYGNDGDIYWWTDVESQHSRNIAHNPTIYITIFDSTAPEGEGSGLYIRAAARVVPENEIAHAREIYNRFARTFRLSPRDTEGDCPMKLYVAMPEKMWVNAESSREGRYVDVREEL